MKRGISILVLAWLLVGCEQLDDLTGQMFGEDISEKTSTPEEPPVDPPAEAPPPDKNVATRPSPQPPKQPPEQPQPPQPPKQPSPPKPSGPVIPKATAELLRIVNNWQGIPESAFPRQVALVRPLNIGFRDSSGNSTGTTTYPAGAKLFAFDQVGQYLHLGPSKSSSLRALVGMDQTNLKTILIYAYEMTKLRQAELAMTQSPIASTRVPSRPGSKPKTKPRSTSGAKPTPKARPTPRPGRKSNNSRSTQNGLFDDLPEPRDLGHGKWCVCPNCRKLRGPGKGGVLYPD